jgi:formate C-acetyltransferase
MDDAKRIEILRSRCLDRKLISWPRCVVVDAESMRNSESVSSWQIRRGLLARDRLLSMKFEIDDIEILAGRIKKINRSETEKADAEEYLKTVPIAVPGQTGHCELDRARVFELGIGGMIDDIKARLIVCDYNESKETYQSFIYALEGLSGFIDNAGKAARHAITSGTPEWRVSELNEIAYSCKRITSGPPRSFRDALQLLWLVDMGVMIADYVGLTLPGRIDQTLYPFYKKDIENGILTDEKTLLLMEQLYLLINEFVYDGVAMSVMAGGKDFNGNDLTNELSYFAFDALRRTDLVYPTVGVCWHEKTPDKLTDLAVELISKGYSTPAFFGDEVIQKGLKKYGVPEYEAWNYINSACVEITPSGGSNIWVASPYFSLCGILKEEIDSLPEEADTESFETFMESYLKRLSVSVKEGADIQNERREKRFAHGGKPLQSVFTSDCIERGVDIDRGGARYNWVECSFVGLANLADSLYVIKKEVFDEKKMSLERLKEILDKDFEGFETERLRFSKYPKYGNSSNEVDEILKRISAFIEMECAKHKMKPDDSHFVPGAFCWVMHERLGGECGATPDGRFAGQPFADGGGPAQGREKNGPTSAVLSTVSWDQSAFIGGVAFNMKFNKSLLNSPESVRKLRDIIVTFLKKGGFETQINVVDREILKKATENPDDYRDLVVRIGGYTDYFTRLSPKMQEEVMMRTEYSEI